MHARADSRNCRELHAALLRACNVVSAANVTLSNANSPERRPFILEFAARTIRYRYRIRDREPRCVRVRNPPLNSEISQSNFQLLSLSLSLSLSRSLFLSLFFSFSFFFFYVDSYSD